MASDPGRPGEDLSDLAERFFDLWREQLTLMADDPAAAEGAAAFARFWQPFLSAGAAPWGGPGASSAASQAASEAADLVQAFAGLQAAAAGCSGGSSDDGSQRPPPAGPGNADRPAPAAAAPDERDRLLRELDRRLRSLEERLDALERDAGPGGAGPRPGARGSGGKTGGGKRAAAKRTKAKRPDARRR